MESKQGLWAIPVQVGIRKAHTCRKCCLRRKKDVVTRTHRGFSTVLNLNHNCSALCMQTVRRSVALCRKWGRQRVGEFNRLVPSAQEAECWHITGRQSVLRIKAWPETGARVPIVPSLSNTQNVVRHSCCAPEMSHDSKGWVNERGRKSWEERATPIVHSKVL